MPIRGPFWGPFWGEFQRLKLLPTWLPGVDPGLPGVIQTQEWTLGCLGLELLILVWLWAARCGSWAPRSGSRAPDPELSGIGNVHSSWALGCQEWILGSQERIQGSQEWILGCQGLELLTLVGQWAARSGSWTCRTCSTHSTRRTRRSLRARSAPRTYRTCRTCSAPSTPRKIQY